MTVVLVALSSLDGSGAPALAVSSSPPQASYANAPYQWHADRGKGGIISVVASLADHRAIVMRDGVEVGSAPVRYAGTLSMPVAYVLRARDGDGDHWLKLNYAGTGGSMEVSPDEASRFDTPTMFRKTLSTILSPGSVIIVTPQPLKAGEPGKSLTVIENDEASSK